MTLVFRIQDGLSTVLFWIAAAALTAAVGLTVFEVGTRYLFDRPTTWSGEAVSYGLALIIFLGLPDVTRRGAHIAIDIVPDALPQGARAILGRINALVGAAATFGAGLIVAGEALRQFDRGLLTNAAHPIPRWWITAVIATGLLLAAAHFLRTALSRRETGA